MPKKVLMIPGDDTEAYESMVKLHTLEASGHMVYAVCQGEESPAMRTSPPAPLATESGCSRLSGSPPGMNPLDLPHLPTGGRRRRRDLRVP